MPVTRSASRQSSTAANNPPVSGGKRKAEPRTKEEVSNGAVKKARGSRAKKAAKVARDAENGANSATPIVPAIVQVPATPATFLPAVLSFSFEDAKQHLVSVDPRFEDLFSKLKCRPFEHLERVDPFRTLATSILGQQISWLAARSIVHRFIRLFDPSLPEKPTDSGSTSNPDSFFPSAHQVVAQDIATLRTAGLSGRKAEYVQDLAARFADGRLSNEKIMQANDEELYEMLTAVRGIGKWTVDMFAIFSLRRPDIMPVGDLGVQRGVVRWFLSLHSAKHPVAISPKKLPSNYDKDKGESQETNNNISAIESQDVVMPENPQPERASTPDAAAFPPAPVTPVKGRKGSKNSGEDPEVPAPPPAFTPSINRTLNKVLPNKFHPPSLPEGLSVKDLQSRLEGKKQKKGVFLTPKEMEELTEPWKPYRSIGVYYMWALSEGDKS
ncbi:DNA glycosylase [Fomitiporia mediterranea MF3/22]|uniref:DNA glycosylase n=1 Tax=Fomitiporia mediterranea (strain MF3/22) TaxID=694068 RepID=UPI000440879F|nr:DNA glycosylase [Fomitiporia mediterranea MF3/22]EJD03373.1 DNA glycosylase [Fomitiporia mediterranea MF3/22]